MSKTYDETFRSDADCGGEMRRAIQSQVGGDHYKKMRIQPVIYIAMNNLGFLEGNIVKYISRHRSKGRAEDIKKIIQCAQMILEMEYGEPQQ